MYKVWIKSMCTFYEQCQQIIKSVTLFIILCILKSHIILFYSLVRLSLGLIKNDIAQAGTWVMVTGHLADSLWWWGRPRIRFFHWLGCYFIIPVTGYLFLRPSLFLWSQIFPSRFVGMWRLYQVVLVSLFGLAESLFVVWS